MIKRFLVFGSLLAVWLLVVGFVAKSAVDRLSAPPWGNPSGGATTLMLVDDTRIGQTFTAPLPGLHRIDLLLEVETIEPGAQIAIELRGQMREARLVQRPFYTPTYQRKRTGG